MRKEKLFKPRIFPTITTISQNWPEKIKEVKKLGLKEVCFFPTCLKEKERKKAYNLIGKTKIKRIPLVHLREDMKPEELDFLVKKYKTQAFNLHAQSEYPLIYDYSKYRKMIYIENAYHNFNKKELNYFGGVCIDFSHLENDRIIHKEKFKKIIKIIKRYKIGCNHISTIKKTSHWDKGEGAFRYDAHRLIKASELDYLKNYPKNYFSDIIAIELENSIKEQLSVKKYIIDILREK